MLFIFQWFKNTVKGDDSLPAFLGDMFACLDPIYQFHLEFLKEIEQRLAMWEGKSNAHLNGDYQRIGDIMVNSFLTSLGVSVGFIHALAMLHVLCYLYPLQRKFESVILNVNQIIARPFQSCIGKIPWI